MDFNPTIQSLTNPYTASEPTFDNVDSALLGLAAGLGILGGGAASQAEANAEAETQAR